MTTVRQRRHAVPVAGCLLALLALLASTACGTEKSNVESGIATASGEPIPNDVDHVYAEVMTILDATYDEAGRPAASFDSLGRVQDRATKRLSSRVLEWPPGTSYALSTLEDHIFVFVSQDGEEKQGDWVPHS